MHPIFQSVAEALDFMIESIYCLRNLLGIPLTGDFLQAEGGLESRLGREISNRTFQSMDESLQVVILKVFDRAVDGFHLLGKVVQKQKRQLI